MYFDIFQLVRHAGFSAEYVERMSPAERELYKNYYIQDSKESALTDENENAVNDLGLDIGDLL